MNLESRSEKMTPFQRIGGVAAISRLVDAFYTRIDTLPEARTIRAMHEADLTQTGRVLKRYLEEWLGGPALYSQERGHPRMKMRHMRFKIGETERDAWMLCMRGALEEVIPDTELREELDAKFFKLADWMRNQT